MSSEKQYPQKPVIVRITPSEIDIPSGKYFWCACGRSKKHPFCDGSHYGTGIKPKRFIIDTSKKVWLCNCKRTHTAPYCDSSHKELCAE